MAQRLTVREGQRYAESTQFLSVPLVWEVKTVHQTATKIPHALLVNVRDRHESKTISCRVLTDENFYSLVAETAPEGSLVASEALFKGGTD